MRRSWILVWLVPVPLLACLVQDVEIVQSLGRASSGNASVGGSPVEPSGGRSGGGGGASSGGGTAGANEPDVAGSGDGGSAGPTAGAAGMTGEAGAAGSGGSPLPAIPALNVCDDVEGVRLCTDFEQPLASPAWPQGSSAYVTERDDAPSGGHVLAAPEGIPVVTNIFDHPYTVSMWVRLASSVEQPLISLTTSDGYDSIGFGIGHGRLRWMHSGAVGTFSPSNELLSVEVPLRTWVCLEVLVETTDTLFGRVVIPGGVDFSLPVLDNTPSAGNDDSWMEALGTPWTIGGGLSVGNNTGGVLIDDLMVTEATTLSLCDRFLEAK